MHQVLRRKNLDLLTAQGHTCATYQMSYGYTRYCALFTPNQLKWHQNMEDWKIMFLFLLQWVMLRFPFAVSIPNESFSEQKHVMTMVTVSDAGKRLIKTTQARPDCRELLFPVKVVFYIPQN